MKIILFFLIFTAYSINGVQNIYANLQKQKEDKIKKEIILVDLQIKIIDFQIKIFEKKLKELKK